VGKEAWAGLGVGHPFHTEALARLAP